MGVSAAGSGTIHAISGTFVQTSAGTLALRVGSDGNDALQITGAAHLAGTEVAVFQSGNLRDSYTLLTVRRRDRDIRHLHADWTGEFRYRHASLHGG